MRIVSWTPWLVALSLTACSRPIDNIGPVQDASALDLTTVDASLEANDASHGGDVGPETGVREDASALDAAPDVGCGDCDDDNSCTTDTCNAGACEHVALAAGSSCEDGDFCTVSETCNTFAACVGGAPRDCDDGGDCTIDSCDEEVNVCAHDREEGLCTFTETDKLVAVDTTPRAGLGYAVSLSGTRAAIGAPWEDVDGFSDAGAVYTFVVNSEGRWVVEARVVSDVPSTEAWFGGSVDLDGTTLVVGAWRERVGPSERGTAYVFEVDGPTSTVLVDKLTPPTDRTYGYFGKSVSISGDTIAVGTPSGRAAHVYAWSGSGWAFSQTLSGTLAGLDDANFGWSVSLDGNRMIVGSPGPGGSATFAGRAVVYERADTNFTQVAALEPIDGEPNDQYGFSVSISGGKNVVGAYRASPGDISESGAVYVTTRGEGTWSDTVKIVASDAARDNWFGAAVALDGYRMLVGSFDTRATGSGYVFDFDGTTWNNDARLTTSTAAEVDLTGWAVALHQGRAIIGSYWSDATGEDNGSAYFFDLSAL